jgi:hypothetical protein
MGIRSLVFAGGRSDSIGDNMTRNWKRDAIIVKCSPDEVEHMYLDNCWNCAPWWYRVPVCPSDRRKLTTTGFCRTCRGHFNTDHVYLLATHRGKDTSEQ